MARKGVDSLAYSVLAGDCVTSIITGAWGDFVWGQAAWGATSSGTIIGLIPVSGLDSKENSVAATEALAASVSALDYL